MKTYKGINYIIWKHPEHLYYCCYVQLPPEHKWIKFLKIGTKVKGLLFKVSDFEKIPVKCHGGLTFGQYFKRNTIRFTKGGWIGWDFAHSGLNDYIPTMIKNNGTKQWTEKELISECKAVIKQVISVSK